jgi:hypothetical protein
MNKPWLFPIPIEGEGTGDIEALSSYLLRIASVHSVASGTLATMILDRFSFSDAIVRRSAFNVSGESFIRPNAASMTMVRATSAAIGYRPERLECTTFLATIDALQRSQSVFSHQLRWCPACFRECIDQDRPAYFKLKWQVRFVECCDIHHIRLRTSCPNCGASQGGGRLRDSLHDCVRCKVGLHGGSKRGDLVTNLFDQLGELVSHIASHPGYRFPKAGVARVVGGLLHDAWKDEREAELFRTLHRDECVRFANEAEAVTLQSALRIAFRLHIPLVSLLEGKIEGTNRSLLPGVPEAFPRSLAPARYDSRRLTDEVESKLAAALNHWDPNSPPSLSALSREVGASVGGLRYRFPKEASRVVAVAKQHRDEHQRHIDRQVRARVAELGKELSGQLGIPPSRKALLRMLRADSGLPKHRLRREISQRVGEVMTPRTHTTRH